MACSSQSSSSSSHSSRTNTTATTNMLSTLLLLCCSALPLSQGYTATIPQPLHPHQTAIHHASTALNMKSYKPPVQNSVRKLHRHSGGGKTQSLQRKASVANSISTAPRSFEDRMRGVLGQQDVVKRRQAPTTVSTKTLPANLHYCHTLEQYKELVADEETQLVVVGFFASDWCKACQAAVPWFHKLATVYPQIKFVHVPVTQKNINLHQGLGVERLPSGHVYHPTEGLVQEDIRLTKKCLAGANSDVSKLLQWYVQGSCELNAVGDCRDPMEIAQEKRP